MTGEIEVIVYDLPGYQPRLTIDFDKDLPENPRLVVSRETAENEEELLRLLEMAKSEWAMIANHRAEAMNLKESLESPGDI